MTAIVIVVLILVLLAILISYAPRVSERNKTILFVVLVLLTVLYLLKVIG